MEGNAASKEFDADDIAWNGVGNSICVIVPIIMFVITNELYVERK